MLTVEEYCALETITTSRNYDGIAQARDDFRPIEKPGDELLRRRAGRALAQRAQVCEHRLLRPT